ncbi:hypothetical protein AOLI_G00130710 [Acnodon oligacanthus]
MAKVFVFGFSESAPRRLQRADQTSDWTEGEPGESFLGTTETDTRHSDTRSRCTITQSGKTIVKLQEDIRLEPKPVKVLPPLNLLK